MAELLIIDDDTASSAAMAALLRREGHYVECAAAAGEALHLLHQREPDLVLLDIEMPRTDGLHLLDALRDEPRFADLKVAIFSGRDEPQTVEAAGRLGAAGYIHKGESWNAIYGRISALLADDTPPA